MNRIDYDVALELASHEAVVRQAYRDVADVWTWSIGITNASGHNVERYIDTPASMERCLEVYVWALQRYAHEVLAAFGDTPLTKAQFAAALSFHYNTGAISRATWVKKFRAGDVAGARKSFMDWRKPAAIIPRRRKERDLFFDGVWSNAGTILEYTAVSRDYRPINPVRVNVEADLRRALNADVPIPSPRPEVASDPDSGGDPEPRPVGGRTLLDFLAALFRAIFRRK